MSNDFTVTIKKDTKRGREWIRVLGTNTVYVKSPLAQTAELANIVKPGPSLVYELDLDLLTPDQRQRLVAHIAQKLDYPEDVVDLTLEDEGMPILADDVTVGVRNPQKWL